MKTETCASCYSLRPEGSAGGACIVAHCNDARSPFAFEAVDPERDWCAQYEQRKPRDYVN